MKKFYLKSEDSVISSIPLHKSSSIGDLACRIPTRFVKNGDRMWLIVSNGKVFTNAVDDLKPRYGNLIGYKYRRHLKWTYSSVLNLLYGANLIAKDVYEKDLERMKAWEQEEEKAENYNDLRRAIKKLDFPLTPKQKKLLGVNANGI